MHLPPLPPLPPFRPVSPRDISSVHMNHLPLPSKSGIRHEGGSPNMHSLFPPVFSKIKSAHLTIQNHVKLPPPPPPPPSFISVSLLPLLRPLPEKQLPPPPNYSVQSSLTALSSDASLHQSSNAHANGANNHNHSHYHKGNSSNSKSKSSAHFEKLVSCPSLPLPRLPLGTDSQWTLSLAPSVVPSLSLSALHSRAERGPSLLPKKAYPSSINAMCSGFEAPQKSKSRAKLNVCSEDSVSANYDEDSRVLSENDVQSTVPASQSSQIDFQSPSQFSCMLPKAENEIFMDFSSNSLNNQNNHSSRKRHRKDRRKIRETLNSCTFNNQVSPSSSESDDSDKIEKMTKIYSSSSQSAVEQLNKNSPKHLHQTQDTKTEPIAHGALNLQPIAKEAATEIDTEIDNKNNNEREKRTDGHRQKNGVKVKAVKCKNERNKEKECKDNNFITDEQTYSENNEINTSKEQTQPIENARNSMSFSEAIDISQIDNNMQSDNMQNDIQIDEYEDKYVTRVKRSSYKDKIKAMSKSGANSNIILKESAQDLVQDTHSQSKSDSKQEVATPPSPYASIFVKKVSSEDITDMSPTSSYACSSASTSELGSMNYLAFTSMLPPSAIHLGHTLHSHSIDSQNSNLLFSPVSSPFSVHPEALEISQSTCSSNQNSTGLLPSSHLAGNSAASGSNVAHPIVLVSINNDTGNGLKDKSHSDTAFDALMSPTSSDSSDNATSLAFCEKNGKEQKETEMKELRNIRVFESSSAVDRLKDDSSSVLFSPVRMNSCLPFSSNKKSEAILKDCSSASSSNFPSSSTSSTASLCSSSSSSNSSSCTSSSSLQACFPSASAASELSSQNNSSASICLSDSPKETSSPRYQSQKTQTLPSESIQPNSSAYNNHSTFHDAQLFEGLPSPSPTNFTLISHASSDYPPFASTSISLPASHAVPSTAALSIKEDENTQLLLTGTQSKIQTATTTPSITSSYGESHYQAAVVTQQLESSGNMTLLQSLPQPPSSSSSSSSSTSSSSIKTSILPFTASAFSTLTFPSEAGNRMTSESNTLCLSSTLSELSILKDTTSSCPPLADSASPAMRSSSEFSIDHQPETASELQQQQQQQPAIFLSSSSVSSLAIQPLQLQLATDAVLNISENESNPLSQRAKMPACDNSRVEKSVPHSCCVIL